MKKRIEREKMKRKKGRLTDWFQVKIEREREQEREKRNKKLSDKLFS